MSDQKKGIQEGPPIWVESLMNATEWKENYKKYPANEIKELVTFDPSYHKGGKWRAGMGAKLSSQEVDLINKRIDEILKKVKDVLQSEAV
jgi:hypothetical protein